MFYIINDFPVPASTFQNIKRGDSVVFTDNAVLALKQGIYSHDKFIHKAIKHLNLYVRQVDLILQNMSNKELPKGVVVLDESDFKKALSPEIAEKSFN
jgi:sulfur transfer complex TusBCD TusB component (DsrH family)